MSVLVFVLAVPVFALGLRAFVRGQLRVGTDKHSLWNRIVLWQAEPGRLHPIMARIAGLLLMVIGATAVVQSVRSWL